MKKYGFILEVLVALVGLEAINRFALKEPIAPTGFIGLEPHPYWLIVVLIAVRYGVAAGFWGAALCAAALIVCRYEASDPKNLEVFRSPDNFLTNFWEPLAFIAVGAVVGEIRTRQDHRLRHAQERAERAEAEGSGLRDDLDAVQQSKEELQRRIVGQVQTVSTLYASAKRLESLKIDELHPAILDLLAQYMGATACSIYTCEAGRLIRKDYHCANDADAPSSEYGLEGSVMGHAIQRGSAVAVPELVTEADFDRFQGDALLAAPIRGLDLEIIGVIAVHKMTFGDFNASNRKLFDMIADWGNTAIQNALYYQQATDKNIRDDELGLFNYNYFQQRIEEEFADSKRHEIPLSLMIVHFKIHEDFPRDRYVRFLQSLSLSLDQSLRKVDLVTKYRTEGTLAILVRTKKTQDVTILAERLQNEVVQLAGKVQLRAGDIDVTIGVATLEEHMASVADLVGHAETAAGLRAEGGSA